MARPVRTSVVLIMFAGYLAMGLLVLEQNRVIESQRTLIRALFGDSTLLAGLRVKEVREHKK
jgi:hypothetical protein